MDILNEVRKEKEIKNMNSNVKGVLQILLVLVLIAAFAFVAGKDWERDIVVAQRTSDWAWI